MQKPIQIFRPGQHTASNGAALDFTEAHLAASAAAYDPAKHEAPIVVGHPTHDAPAYGWVKSLAYADGLEAEPHQVDPAFAEMFAAGRFKKISASFYTPDSPSNPVPGVYYLRHVGCLGAQPPAVKGLRNPEFADAEEGVVEFADWASFTETKLPTQGDEMSAEEKARLAALELENATLKQDVANFAEAQAKAKRDALHAEHLAFAETLVTAGKLLPAHKEVTVATLDFMAGQETVVEFGEGDAKKPLAETYKLQLVALPKIVEFKEVAGGKGTPEDVELDPSAVAAAAIEFQEAEAAAGRSITTAQAVQHINQTKGKKI